MLRQDRLVDINRYKKYRDKGRISPRGIYSTGSSIGTASLSTSPLSFSSTFFSGSSKSEDDQDSGVTQATPNEKSMAHYTNNSDLLEKTRRQLQNKAEMSRQTKVERNRKLEKFEKFKRAKKTFELKKKLLEISYPPEPSITQLSQVSATKMGATFGSSRYKDSVPKRIIIVESPAKENQPIFVGSRQSVDPPRNVLQIVTQALTPRKTPTPRNATSRAVHSTTAIDPPRNSLKVATQVLSPRKAPTPRKTEFREKQTTTPIDPPRNASLVVTQALTPRKAPTPRKIPLKAMQPAMSASPNLRTPRTPRAEPLTPRGFAPLNLPSTKEIKKKVEDRYDQIKREPPARNVSTTSPQEKVLGATSVESQDHRNRLESSLQNNRNPSTEIVLFQEQDSGRGLEAGDRPNQTQMTSSVQSTLEFHSASSQHQDDKGRSMINVEEKEIRSQFRLPTTLVADPYNRKVVGTENHPICLEDIIDLSDAVEPPPTPKTFLKPIALQIQPHTSTPRLPITSFDYTFPPKMKTPQSTKIPTPSVQFDFTPSNTALRPKSTSRARTGSTKFSFSTPSPVSKLRPNETTPSSIRSKETPIRSQSASRLHDRDPFSGLTQSFASTGLLPMNQTRETNYQFPKTQPNERKSRQSTSETTEPSAMVILSPESQLRINTSLFANPSGPFASNALIDPKEAKAPSSAPRRQSGSIIHRHATVKERFLMQRGIRDADEKPAHHSTILIRAKRPMTPREQSMSLTRDYRSSPNEEHICQEHALEKVDSDEAAQRSARMIYAQDFYRMIQKQKLRDRYLNKGRNSRKRQRCGGNGVSFVVRKRPIAETEIENGEYDVINTETSDAQGIIVYETKVLSDLKAKELVPHSFRCNQVISDLQNTDDLYVRVAQPLVDLVNGGGFATIVMCGTDGSGKNENRVAIEEHLVNDIFASQAAEKTVTVQYVELCGKNCYDLLSPGSFVEVVDKEGGYFQLEGAKTETISNAHEMLRIFSNAKRRLVSRTKVRKQKDEQSFMLCQIKINQQGLSQRTGCLSLLGCPVSDFDGVWVPTVDTTKANTTLDTLLQCISAKISQRTITNPFRNINNLTKLMKESFEKKESQICVLAAISPVATETENTLTTLSSMCNVMRGSKPRHRATNDGSLQIHNSAVLQDQRLILPRQWTNEQLMCWMTKKNLVDDSVSSNVNGRVAMRLTKQQLNQTFYDTADINKASKLYDALRAENDRIARLRVKKRMSLSLQEYNK